MYLQIKSHCEKVLEQLKYQFQDDSYITELLNNPQDKIISNNRPTIWDSIFKHRESFDILDQFYLEMLQELHKEFPCEASQVSDGYHTFEELYNHRMILFSIICNSYPYRAWKSKLHHDGTMYDNYFIVGINTPEGDFTYHYHLDHWDKFQVKELPNAPEWDGHTSDDILRLYSLL